MLSTAKLLGRCSEALGDRRRPLKLFRETWYGVLALRTFLTWEEATLSSYCEALFPIRPVIGEEGGVNGRPYLVRERVETMAWSGTIWAVGCNTWESAERAFHNRVARNVADGGDAGTVEGFDRRRGLLICWTSKASP